MDRGSLSTPDGQKHGSWQYTALHAVYCDIIQREFRVPKSIDCTNFPIGGWCCLVYYAEVPPLPLLALDNPSVHAYNSSIPPRRAWWCLLLRPPALSLWVYLPAPCAVSVGALPAPYAVSVGALPAPCCTVVRGAGGGAVAGLDTHRVCLPAALRTFYDLLASLRGYIYPWWLLFVSGGSVCLWCASCSVSVRHSSWGFTVSSPCGRLVAEG